MHSKVNWIENGFKTTIWNCSIAAEVVYNMIQNIVPDYFLNCLTKVGDVYSHKMWVNTNLPQKM